MLTATADTNIYISALNFGGQPLRFLDAARAGVIGVDISAAILDEVLRVLGEKFNWEPDRLDEAESLISGFTRRVIPSVSLDVILEDPPDNRTPECAVEAESDYIVTGDRDLLRIKQYGSIHIIKVSDFLIIASQRPNPDAL